MLGGRGGLPGSSRTRSERGCLHPDFPIHTHATHFTRAMMGGLEASVVTLFDTVIYGCGVIVVMWFGGKQDCQ